ncbi:MAG: hypothetical protein R3E93_13970 [Thiothrix sp.]
MPLSPPGGLSAWPKLADSPEFLLADVHDDFTTANILAKLGGLYLLAAKLRARVEVHGLFSAHLC